MPPGNEGGSPDLEILARLTGVRSSKLSFYRQYRRTASSLNRSVRALASASTALTAIRSGPVHLVEVFLPCVVEIMDAEWAALVALHAAFGQEPYALAATPDGLLSDLSALPGGGAGMVELLAAARSPQAREVAPSASGAWRCVSLPWSPDGCGWLVVSMGARRSPDDTDEAILATLANQLGTAVQVTHLLAEGERLRAAATQAYDEVSAHARQLAATNRQLRQARTALARARESEAVEAERERLARELHDSVAQRVLAIGMALESCRADAPDESLRARLAAAQELARGTVETIRNAIFELSAVDDLLPGGLLPSMRAIAKQVSPNGPEVTVHRVGTPIRLPLAIERTLLIVLREALFNVVLHSGADRCRVSIGYAADEVTLSVTDNGTGRPDELHDHLHEALRSRSGYHRGLAFVYQRIQQLGGTLDVARAAEGGIRLTVTVPAQERSQL